MRSSINLELQGMKKKHVYQPILNVLPQGIIIMWFRTSKIIIIKDRESLWDWDFVLQMRVYEGYIWAEKP